jgi:hypothetical protein
MAEARAPSARAHGAGLPAARALAAVMLFVLALALRAKSVEDSRGIQQAVLLLQESRSRTDVLRAMDTLGEAAGQHGGREAIARYRHGEALLAVVSAMTDFSGHPEIIASACSFISSMSMGKKPRTALAQAAAVELIVSALNIHSEHTGVLEQCCGRWLIPFSHTAAPPMHPGGLQMGVFMALCHRHRQNCARTRACGRAHAGAHARANTRTYARTHRRLHQPFYRQRHLESHSCGGRRSRRHADHGLCDRGRSRAGDKSQKYFTVSLCSLNSTQYSVFV